MAEVINTLQVWWDALPHSVQVPVAIVGVVAAAVLTWLVGIAALSLLGGRRTR